MRFENRIHQYYILLIFKERLFKTEGQSQILKLHYDLNLLVILNFHAVVLCIQESAIQFYFSNFKMCFIQNSSSLNSLLVRFFRSAKLSCESLVSCFVSI